MQQFKNVFLLFLPSEIEKRSIAFFRLTGNLHLRRMEKIKSMINSFTSFALKVSLHMPKIHHRQKCQANMLRKFAHPAILRFTCLTTFTANIKYRIDSRAVKCWIMKLLTFQTGLPMWKTRRMWHFVQFKVDRLRAYHTTYIFNIENDRMIF